MPTITVQSETDVIGMQGFRARCDDTATARFWEIAGAAHFDTWGLLVSQDDDGTLPAGAAGRARSTDHLPRRAARQGAGGTAAPSSTTSWRRRWRISRDGAAAANPLARALSGDRDRG